MTVILNSIIGCKDKKEFYRNVENTIGEQNFNSDVIKDLDNALDRFIQEKAIVYEKH